ncbi:MAG: hypothetical protein K8T91_28260 [Planctomycetes bacterium]|nr:hypothetical protein [Planctomycetota bacterium]
MTFSLGLVLSVAMAVPPVSEGPVVSLSHNLVRPGQRFEIATLDRVMRGEFVDPATGECLAATKSFGQQFGQPQRLWLLGATQGNQPGAGGLQLTFMHQIRVGMKMELGLGDLSREHRVVTQPVRSITLLGSPSSQQTVLR